MEILIGVVIVIGILVLFVVAGKVKGPPEPSAMSEAGIRQRIETENEWIFKFFYKLSDSQRSSPAVKRMYEGKVKYVQELKAELARRELAKGVEFAHRELAPLIERRDELMKNGKSESEATAQAHKEWNDKGQ